LNLDKFGLKKRMPYGRGIRFHLNLMPKVKIKNLYYSEEFGECVVFTDMNGEFPMSYLNSCPINRFVDMYSRSENE